MLSPAFDSDQVKFMGAGAFGRGEGVARFSRAFFSIFFYRARFCLVPSISHGRASLSFFLVHSLEPHWFRYPDSDQVKVDSERGFKTRLSESNLAWSESKLDPIRVKRPDPIRTP